MGIDRPDDAAVPSDDPGDHPSAPGNDGQQPGIAHVETRYREEYYSARTQVAQEERTQVAQEERTQNRQPATQPDTWAETAVQARWMWGESHRRWSPEARPQVDR